MRKILKPYYKVVNKNANSLRNIIKPRKDKIKNKDKINAVYKIDCKNCKSKYIGQTKRKVSMSAKEHCRNLTQTQAPHNNISEHCLNPSHCFDFCNVKLKDIEPVYKSGFFP